MAEPLPAAFSRYTEPEVRPEVEAPARVESLTAVPSFVEAAKAARPSVVHIKSRFQARRPSRNGDFFSNPFREFFDEGEVEAPQSMASGSGVIISPDGYIATNNHVIEDADVVEVTLFDNRTLRAEVIGVDLSTDLALLKVDGRQFPHLTFANSDEVEVGQWVLAVGNPMDLTSTVTAGIVSAKGRNINLLRADSEFAIESFIQTDAAVNKGNSGGALVDLEGRLVGINTAIASRTGYYAGYSFAIPATIVRKVMEDLLSFGEVRRGFLGVSIRPVDAELADAEGLSVLKGAFVSSVNADLGAAEAGIEPGDVIISVNQVPVSSSSELQEQVSRFRPGDRVRIVAIRGRAEKEFTVVLKPLSTAISAVDTQRDVLEFRDSYFRLLTEAERRELGVDRGVMVEDAGEKMAKGGIQQGFVITEVDGQEIASIEALEDALMDSGEYIT
ncbi:MAG: PDZ domain-containing protein, partial [Bacteroidetes bacterium]